MPMSKQLKNAIAKAGAFEAFAREQSKRNRIANRMQGLDERMMRQQMRGMGPTAYGSDDGRVFQTRQAARNYGSPRGITAGYKVVNPRYLSPEEASAQYRQLQAQLANQDMNLANIRAMGDQRGLATSRGINDQYNRDLYLLSGGDDPRAMVKEMDQFNSDINFADENPNVDMDPLEYAEEQFRNRNPEAHGAFSRAASNWDYEQSELGPYMNYWEYASPNMSNREIRNTLSGRMRQGYIPPEERGVPTPGYYEDLLGKARQDREAAFQRWLDMQQQPPRYR